MATMEEKMGAFTKLMQDGILTADEFARVIAALNGSTTAAAPVKEKTPLEKQYDEVFSKHIIKVFKSPASCKWPELESSMIKKGTIKIVSTEKYCTYIETYIDAPNSYGAMLRKQLRLVMDDNGNITNALEELQFSGVTLLGTIANAANKDTWHDIVTLPYGWYSGSTQNSTSASNGRSNLFGNTSPSSSSAGSTWTCKKCGDSNPSSSRICRGCGEYK